MFSTPSATIAAALPLFTLLYSIAAVTEMTWSIAGSSAGTCGLFQCCDSGSATCKAITSSSNNDKTISRSQAVGAFILLSILLNFVHVPIAFLASKNHWATKFASVSVAASVTEVIFLWLSFFIAVGAYGVGYGRGGSVLLHNAAVLALAGLFFALYAKEKAGPAAPTAEITADGEVAKSSALLSVGGYNNPVGPGAAGVPSPYQPAAVPASSAPTGYQGYNAYAGGADHAPYTAYNPSQ